jgi:hypothetical protein
VHGSAYVQTFLVAFKGRYSVPSLLFNGDSRLPKYGDTYTSGGIYDTSAYVSNIEVSLKSGSVLVGTTSVAGQALYKVTYSPKSTLSLDLHPLSRPPEISGGGADITYTPLTDVDGHAYRNSAGVLYENLPERYLPSNDVEITRNEGSNPFAAALSYSRTTNSSAITLSGYTVAAEGALLGKIRIQKVYEQWEGTQITYWRVTYPITIRSDGWRVKVIDSGPSYKDGSGKLIRFKDPTGTEIGTQLLNGSGGKLADGADPVIYPTAGFKNYPTANWYSALSLPDWTA